MYWQQKSTNTSEQTGRNGSIMIYHLFNNGCRFFFLFGNLRNLKYREAQCDLIVRPGEIIAQTCRLVIFVLPTGQHCGQWGFQSLAAAFPAYNFSHVLPSFRVVVRSLYKTLFRTAYNSKSNIDISCFPKVNFFL